MATTRSVRDAVKNVLDFLVEAELAIFANEVSMIGSRVSFHGYDALAPFLSTRNLPTIEQYLNWVESGCYSAVLLDGSLLQITYDIEQAEIIGHRLAYVPCPFDVDQELLSAGEPIADVVDLYRSGDAVLRSPVRFDFDARLASPDHPAAHLTINGPDCRIACVAPIHILRFIDFVFRQFYHKLWEVHRAFFSNAGRRHIGPSVLQGHDRRIPYLMWDVSEGSALQLRH